MKLQNYFTTQRKRSINQASVSAFYKQRRDAVPITWLVARITASRPICVGRYIDERPDEAEQGLLLGTVRLS